MINDVVIKKSEIYRILLQEYERIVSWVSSGNTPAEIYKKLRTDHPEIIFSTNGFLYNFRKINYDLYKKALSNKSKTRALILSRYNDIAAAIFSGHTLKETHQLVCPQITYNCFIVHLRQNYPDLHSQAKINRITTLRKIS